eukprot:354829-Pelagomonas_calceolata.AAC.1
MAREMAQYSSANGGPPGSNGVSEHVPRVHSILDRHSGRSCRMSAVCFKNIIIWTVASPNNTLPRWCTIGAPYAQYLAQFAQCLMVFNNHTVHGLVGPVLRAWLRLKEAGHIQLLLGREACSSAAQCSIHGRHKISATHGRASRLASKLRAIESVVDKINLAIKGAPPILPAEEEGQHADGMHAEGFLSACTYNYIAAASAALLDLDVMRWELKYHMPMLTLPSDLHSQICMFKCLHAQCPGCPSA